jgi:hypothetical protein
MAGVTAAFLPPTPAFPSLCPALILPPAQVKRVGVQAVEDPNLSLPFAHDRNIPVIVTAHPALLPRPADWERWIHVCGPAVLPAPSDWQPSDELNEFITRGLPPIYISFGSCLQADAEALTALAIDAAQSAGLRAIIDTTFDGVFAQPRRMPQVPPPQPLPSKSRFRIYVLCVTCAGQGKEQRRVCQAVVSTSIGAVTKESDGIYFVQNLPLAAMLPRCSLFVHTACTHQAGRCPPLAVPRYCRMQLTPPMWQRAVGRHPLRLRSLHIRLSVLGRSPARHRSCRRPPSNRKLDGAGPCSCYQRSGVQFVD